MSLKAVHICFIVLAEALAWGFGIWAVRDYSASRNLVNLSLGIGSIAGAVALIGYLFWFLQKMRKVGAG